MIAGRAGRSRGGGNDNEEEGEEEEEEEEELYSQLIKMLRHGGHESTLLPMILPDHTGRPMLFSMAVDVLSSVDADTGSELQAFVAVMLLYLALESTFDDEDDDDSQRGDGGEESKGIGSTQIALRLIQWVFEAAQATAEGDLEPAESSVVHGTRCAVRSIAALDDDDPCWPPSLHIPLEAAGATRAGGRRGRGGKSRRRVPSIPVVGPEDVIAAAAKTYALMCAPSLLRDCDGLDGDGGVDGER
jgi:hypothetical protein